MTRESRGRDLFIVDNTAAAWTGLCYPEQWCGIAKAFAIPTGYFEIRALLALDGEGQPLEKIRILMGRETTHRSRNTLVNAVRARSVEILDAAIATDKQANPFRHRVRAAVASRTDHNPLAPREAAWAVYCCFSDRRGGAAYAMSQMRA